MAVAGKKRRRAALSGEGCEQKEAGSDKTGRSRLDERLTARLGAAAVLLVGLVITAAIVLRQANARRRPIRPAGKTLKGAPDLDEIKGFEIGRTKTIDQQEEQLWIEC